MSEHSDFKESEWCYFHTHTHLKLINVYAFDSWPFGVKILIKLLSAISDKKQCEKARYNIPGLTFYINQQV